MRQNIFINFEDHFLVLTFDFIHDFYLTLSRIARMHRIQFNKRAELSMKIGVEHSL